MNELWQALAHVIEQGGFFTIVVIGLLLAGAGERISHLIDGHHKINARKIEVKTLRAENQRLHELLRTGNDTRHITAAAQDGDTARLAELLDLLREVQATDRVYPQLPQELRDRIDDTIDHHANRKTNTP